ncbi:uncharacterized protein APUU_80796A [Aspergillus puulaauensis]|uniref:Uncharacterized protein n=1 Tax=Aspergillus puulaauensis TaxID=1220207 RepID=A0A7R7Y0V6_9EURO|nr:uncharacterized protein APUU_80796A [Aspergillus puulaauensis]BCS30493.1 hypothetical protein APUU_80796A [Aspergillus puulaauensis]
MPVESIRATTMLYGQLPTCSRKVAAEIVLKLIELLNSVECLAYEIAISYQTVPVEKWTLWVQVQKRKTAAEDWEIQTQQTLSSTVEEVFQGMQIYDGSRLLTLVEPLEIHNIMGRLQESADQLHYETQLIMYLGIPFLPYCDGQLQHVDESHWTRLRLLCDEVLLHGAVEHRETLKRTVKGLQASRHWGHIEPRLLAAIAEAAGPDGLLD